MINRNKFLKLMGSVAATTVIPNLGFAKSPNASSTFRLFDFHCHPGAFHRGASDHFIGGDAFRKTTADMNSANVEGAFISIVSDTPLLQITDKGVEPKRKFRKGEAWNIYKLQKSRIDSLINISETQFITSFAELTKESSKVKLLLACEGADFLEGDLERLDKVYDDGVRSIQLVHYTPNNIGDLQTSNPINQGLSSYGKQIVKQMNKLGMVIDVAHASFKTVQDVAEISDSPLILSHSILKNGSESPVSNRAITSDHAKIIAQTGGVIGAWPSGFSTSLNEFVDNTINLIEVVGIDHVGLGTDMDANYKPVIKNYYQVHEWTEELAKKGLADDEIEKLVNGNAHRVLKQALKL